MDREWGEKAQCIMTYTRNTRTRPIALYANFKKGRERKKRNCQSEPPYLAKNVLQDKIAMKSSQAHKNCEKAHQSVTFAGEVKPCGFRSISV